MENKYGYGYNYEYVDTKGKLRHVYACTVYKTYEAAEEDLCADLSEAESLGYTEVQGEVYERTR